jgi:hypothetical protein
VISFVKIQELSKLNLLFITTEAKKAQDNTRCARTVPSSSLSGRMAGASAFSKQSRLLVADGWCWFVLREEYCWLVATGCWWLVRSERKVLLSGG